MSISIPQAPASDARRRAKTAPWLGGDDVAAPAGANEEILDALGVGIMVLDAQARVVLWNRWLERVSGIGAAAAYGQRLDEIFPDLGQGRLLDAIEGAIRHGFPSILSQSLNKAPLPLFTQVTPRGTRQRIQQKIHVLPLRHATSAPRCLIEIHDVSLAAHRESVLGEQKKFLNTILDNEPECVLVMAEDGQLIQMNRAGLDMLEVTDLAEVRSAGFAGFIQPEQQAGFERLVRETFAGGKGVIEFQVRGKRGTCRWLETHATPLRDAQGKINALLAVARDTTARREAEATTRALIDANMDSAVLLDESGKILAINDIGARRFNASAPNLIGGNFYALLPPALAKAQRDMAAQVFRDGKPLNYQDSSQGTYFDINLYPVFDSAGRVTCVSLYAADVTEQMQLQAVDRLFHDIDQRVLRGHRQQDLFEFICAEVARIFDYQFAWIGRKQAGGAVSVQSSGGSAAAYLDEMRAIGVRWDNSPLGLGPAGTAIRTGQTQTFTTSDAGFAPWRKAAENFSLRSQLSIPLILRGEVYGGFTLASAREAGFGNPATVRRLTDIASRICIAIEHALDQEQLLLLETALSSAANGVFITDKVGRIQWLNAAFETMTGYRREEAVGATPRLLKIGKDDGAFFQDMLENIAAGEAWCGESIERRKDGTSFNARQTITPIRDANGEATHFISILEDVTAAREAEASIQRLAHYDYLTDLPNRALFHDRLGQELARAKRNRNSLALMFIDLDSFKAVNDTHGHDIGDLLLKGVAQRLNACVRESDTVARLAGDEFIVILPDGATRVDLGRIATKIIAAIGEQFVLDRIELLTSVSMGIAIYPEDADTEAGLLKCADAAMYAAKAQGRNNFSFYQRKEGRGDAD